MGQINISNLTIVPDIKIENNRSFYKMNKRPPSGKDKRSSQLLNKEQQYKELNAALEEKSASLINEAESVLREQDNLFGDLSSSFNSGTDFSTKKPNSTPVVATDDSIVSKTSQISTKTQPQKVTPKQRPSSGPTGKTKKKTNDAKKTRPKSAATKQDSLVSEMNLIDERATFANRIHVLETEAADEIYTPVELEENVLPDAANDMGSDATIRFLKAKLRVMEEELENMAADCREKIGTIQQLENEILEKEENEKALLKKNDNLQSLIEKHRKVEDEVRSKNSHLEMEVNSLKKELDNLKREKKQTSANKNTLELRLNRALEEVEKHKTALKSAKESTAALNDADRKHMEQLKSENKKLDNQKSELIVAFKKQLKLIDILKRQKMHIEAAKLLEFSEEEFIRALDWGKS